MVYQHKCPFCGHSWSGRKAVVISCTRCKKRFDYPSTKLPGEQAAIKFIEFKLISAGLPPSVARNEAKFRLNKIIDQGK
jgi:predicted  nucleic acid-binding Zn-ribbon protein